MPKCTGNSIAHSSTRMDMISELHGKSMSKNAIWKDIHQQIRSPLYLPLTNAYLDKRLLMEIAGASMRYHLLVVSSK